MFTKGKRSLARKSGNCKRKITSTPIHTSRGKIIGQVVGDVFAKNMTKAHILNKFNSIASDIYSLHEAERAGAVYVEFTNTDDGVTYRAPICKFWDLGKFIDFGYGSQQMLGLAHFEHMRGANHPPTTDTETPVYSEADTTDVKPLKYTSRATIGVVKNGVQQMTLFGDGE